MEEVEDTEEEEECSDTSGEGDAEVDGGEGAEDGEEDTAGWEGAGSQMSIGIPRVSLISADKNIILRRRKYITCFPNWIAVHVDIPPVTIAR